MVDRIDEQAQGAVVLKDFNYSEVIEAYLEIASRSWSLSTQVSEASRLRALLPLLQEHGFSPDAIYGGLSTQGVGAYTIKTAFIRLSKVYDFVVDLNLVDKHTNPFKSYMKHTAPNKFKTSNVYKPKVVPLTYEQLKVEVDLVADSVLKDTLRFMMQSGLRIHEVYKVQKSIDGNFFVQGKGGKMRPVMTAPPAVLASKGVVQKTLMKFGLTPHALRKLAATKLAASGMVVSDLQQVFGWSSLQTAQSYIQQTDSNNLKNKVWEILK